MTLPDQVETRSTGPDGKDAGPLTPLEISLAVQADALLKADPHWQALAGPTLVRVEANRGLPETTPGYLYLRYSVTSGTPQEFWAHWSTHDHLSWHSGQVSVKSRI